MTRPSYSNLNIGKTIKNTYNNEVAVEIGVNVGWYLENPDPSVGPYFGRDGICFIVFTNFSISHGIGVSLAVKCLPTDENAMVYVESSGSLIQQNVSVIDLKWLGVAENEACVRAKILNSPCYLKTKVHWVFSNQNNKDHLLNAILEVTYFNGTAQRKIVLPVTLLITIP